VDTTTQPFTIEISGLSELAGFAEKLASGLAPGDVLALSGPMGAGKTTLIQRLGNALGICEKIVSPTFVLIHDYVSGQWPLVHIDLYRLGPESSESIAEEILSVIAEGRSIVAVEWAEYGEFLSPMTTVAVAIEPTGEETRHITVRTNRPGVLKALGAKVTS